MKNNHYIEFNSSAFSHLVAKHYDKLSIIVPDNKTAMELNSNFKFFSIDSDYFPDWDVLPFDVFSPSEKISAQRISFLAKKRPRISIYTATALLRKIPNFLEQNLILGQEFKDFSKYLLSIGYTRSTLVEDLGQFSPRGSVIDFFPPGFINPVRVEFDDDLVESIRTFNVGTQRSVEKLESISILPIKEIPQALCFSELDYFWTEAFRKLRSRASELSFPVSVVEGLQNSFTSGLFPQGFEHLWPIIDSELSTIDLDQNLLLFQPDQVFASIDNFTSLLKESTEKKLYEQKIIPKIEDAFIQPDLVLESFNQASTYNKVKFYTESSKDNIEEYDPKNTFLVSNLKLQNNLTASKYSDNPLLPFANDIKEKISEGYSVLIVVNSEIRKAKIKNLLKAYNLEPINSKLDFNQIRNDAGLWIVDGNLSSGFKSVEDKFQIYSEFEIFPENLKRKTSSLQKTFKHASMLEEGDYVVHVDYGIGIYRGLVQKTVSGNLHDFVLLEYAEKSKLFVPVYSISKVQKYSSSEGFKPQLTKLGGKVWEKSKAKVKENVAELAGRLLKVMAEREAKKGISFESSKIEDQKFADFFPFSETPDQLNAIEQVLGDMENSKPMDRLVCGDVGYGKTEVALRAAFKAANSGYQVALLVPTTVLAEQHHKTFKQRFANFPIKVSVVSRFNSSTNNKKILEQVKLGSVDVIIGTHRLLQNDVAFNNLGLIIIDEEHRFGVAHKEKLKKFRSEIDVLTLTATPIPRTLNMSLVGIRDLSLIETPPVDRQVVRTFVARYDEKVIRESILRELNREGQVFYIYNRVQTIAEKAKEIQALVPEAKIEFAHGQMKDSELEEVMHRFVNNEINVLVSTTIVESGLDIQNANTILIQNAQNFGLAELYQLRGRVGRSSRRAYAYLFIGDPKKMTDGAKKRLDVLKALDDLGIGFRLALQDMEIRGAGNLLGKDQSGQINSVGYELYSKILKDAVKALKLGVKEGDSLKKQIDPEINIGFPSHIPIAYIPDVTQRLILYQRMMSLESELEVEELNTEIIDRFGNPPVEVEILLGLMKFRVLLKNHLVLSATKNLGGIRLAFDEEVNINAEKAIALASESKIKLSPNNSIVVNIKAEILDNNKNLELLGFIALEVKKILDQVV